MNLITAIRILKKGVPLRDYNLNPRLSALRTVRGVSHAYMVVKGKACIEYRYTIPTLADDPTERIPALEVIERRNIGIPCNISLGCDNRFTQGHTYRKIADVFSADGTRYYVLIHSILAGALYRRPEHVQLQVAAKAKAA